MYPHYREPPFRRVAEYFPDWVLEAAQAAGVTVILHLPEPLADCLQEVDEVMQHYPRLRVVLAHLGRHSWVDARIANAFERASRHRLLAMDTSMAASQPVHELALRTFGPTRILFGSDEPFNLLRYVPVIDPSLGRHNVSWEPYHWSDVLMHARHRHQAKGALLLHFQVLQALLGAIKNTFPAAEQEVTEHVFWRNGNGWFGATPS